MRLTDNRGVALIMVLILMGVLSVLASSLIFVSQTETWASDNYRLMSEARYGAESGIHKAANFLLYSYTEPGTADMGSYVRTGAHVQYNGVDVQLRSNGSSNYPDSTVISSFVNAAHGTLAGGHQVTYDARATLLSMRQVSVYGSTTLATVQTWQIVGEGTIAGPKPARVDVSAILEQQVTPTFSYAAFATYDGCDALGWSGGGATDSYDSTQLVGGVATFSNVGGNVGTNGNLTQAGSTTIIGGNLSTPRVGVGNCSSGNVTAWTLNGNGQVVGGLVQLPQAVVYPTPDVPTPPPTGDISIPKNGAGNDVTLGPGLGGCPASGTCSKGDIDLKGTLHLTAGTYNINSFNITASGATLQIDSGPVILNVAGYTTAGNAASGLMGIPFDMTGGSLVTNTNLDPAMFQISYAGTGQVRLAGGSTGAALLYAPNADAKLTGGGAWYGAIIAKYVDDTGGAAIHYDRNLDNKALMIGPWMMDSFTWRRF